MSARAARLPPPFPSLSVAADGVPLLTSAQVRRFRSLIRAHFLSHSRPFPWRETRDPYHILVSELMLQQTQTERVASRFPAFIARFPTVESLATSGTSELLRAWRGLGYNRRALALRETARRIVEEHASVVPPDPSVLATFAGIGAATAAEIAAFAYDVPTALIETNIRRVFLYFFFPGDPSVSDRRILPLVQRTLDRRHPRLWYYALMDYGVMMKKALPRSTAEDPNRRSAHYTRQARFQGSDRQIRGIIVSVLSEGGALTEEELRCRVTALRDGPSAAYGPSGSTAPVEPSRLHDIIARLAKEGFVATEGGKVKVP